MTQNSERLVTSHGNPAIRCQVCDRPISKQYIATHMRRKHGIYGGISGRSRKKEKIHHPVPLPPPRTPEPKTFTQMPFVVLEDDTGGVWIAERMR